MTTSLQNDLAELTGEELFNLVNELTRGEIHALNAIGEPLRHRVPAARYYDQWAEMVEVRQVALAQIARITIPIREAAALVYRVRYSRNHPVQVAGTEPYSGGKPNDKRTR